MTTSIGALPISPYDIKLGVLVLILRIFLQNCKCIFSNTCTLLTVKQKLTDQFIQKWYNLIATSSRGNLYGQFKMEFKLENYLLKLSPNERALITKLRCCFKNIMILGSNIIVTQVTYSFFSRDIYPATCFHRYF
jgi:hypothetical protein